MNITLNKLNNICFGSEKPLSDYNSNNSKKMSDINGEFKKDIDFYTYPKPLCVAKNELIQNRLALLKPISSKEEYNEVLKEILSYKTFSDDNKRIEPFVYIWGYENIDPDLKGLVVYCGSEDKSNIINSWLSGRKLPDNFMLDDRQMANVIRAMDYSLNKLDEKFGRYKGVVYRGGFFNPNTDKQFYSTSATSINAVKHSNKFLPAEDNPYSIIRVKNGHNINEFQKNADSFIARKFASTEKEILIDKQSKFRLVPESEYTDTDIRLKNILLTQAVKKDDDIRDRDIQLAVNQYGDLLKHISIWEEI